MTRGRHRGSAFMSNSCYERVLDLHFDFDLDLDFVRLVVDNDDRFQHGLDVGLGLDCTVWGWVQIWGCIWVGLDREWFDTDLIKI